MALVPDVWDTSHWEIRRTGQMTTTTRPNTVLWKTCPLLNGLRGLSMGGMVWAQEESCDTTVQVAEIRWNEKNYNIAGQKLSGTVKTVSLSTCWRHECLKHSEIKFICWNIHWFSTVFHKFLLMGTSIILILPSDPLLLSLITLHSLASYLNAFLWTLSSTTSTCPIVFILPSFPEGNISCYLSLFHLKLMTCNFLIFS